VSKETCPKCNAELSVNDHHYMRFSCGTVIWADKSISDRNYDCLDRQLIQKLERIDELTTQLGKLQKMNEDLRAMLIKTATELALKSVLHDMQPRGKSI